MLKAYIRQREFFAATHQPVTFIETVYTKSAFSDKIKASYT